MDGFKKFILRGNVVDLAVGVVIGAAFNGLVTTFVSSFFTPMISALGGFANFSKLEFAIGSTTFAYGVFLDAIISFLITAGVIYFFVVVPMNRLTERMKKTEEAAPTTKDCPYCLTSVPLKASKCMACASALS